MRGKLLTNKRKARLGLGAPYCHHCGSVIEDEIHVLRDCPVALWVWRHLVKPVHRAAFLHGMIQQWVDLNLVHGVGDADHREWASLWATTCYKLWGWHNKEVHVDGFSRPLFPWREVQWMVAQYGQACGVRGGSLVVKRQVKQINWEPPDKEWVCLNTDGASKHDMQLAGCGGLIRGAEGQWICEFSKYLGYYSAYVAELWGLTAEPTHHFEHH